MDAKLRSALKRWAQEGSEDARLAAVQALLRSGEATFFRQQDTDPRLNLYTMARVLGLSGNSYPRQKSLHHPLFPLTWFQPFTLDGNRVRLGIEWGDFLNGVSGFRGRIGYWLVSDIEGFTEATLWKFDND